MTWLVRCRLCLLVLAVLAAFGVSGSGFAREHAAAFGHNLLRVRGIWTEFNDPSSPNGWYSGELLHNGNFNRARAEVTLQLNAMRSLGVNEIAYELRSADPVLVQGARNPPGCNVSPDTGLQFPQPTTEELTSLGRLFDLVGAKGMKIALLLDNAHMDDRGRSQQWLSAILTVVKTKPALDYVAFGGDTHLIDLNGDGTPESCGGVSEAPLWLGASSVPAAYVQWAIGYGLSLGLHPQQLTAESIVGYYPDEAQADAGPDAEGNHLWSPIAIMKTIFDRLSIPEAERTYAISFYEHRKCSAGSSTPPCVDEDPHAWAQETAKSVRSNVGDAARVTATEFGDLAPVDASWPTERAVEDIGSLMQQYGIDGGTFWRWEDVDGNTPASFGDPVTRRGGFVYYPVERELADLYGFHPGAITNGSFEAGTDGWTTAGPGTATPTQLDGQAPSRGRTFLRLTTRGTLTATSRPSRVTAGTVYTTTLDLRFSWTNTRNPATATVSKRPQVDVAFRYLTCRGRPSALRAQDLFRFFGQTPPGVFQTYPLRYQPPKDACYVSVQLILEANRLPAGITLDADDVR